MVEIPNKQIQREESRERNLEMIERANAAARRIEEAEKKLQEQNDRLERLQIERTLGGTDSVTEQPKQEMTAEEYKNKIMSGEIKGKLVGTQTNDEE